MIGETLGHYQITSQLGKGGMGEVYQAKDQVLGRDVAIKVLPEEFAKDADRVARFQREAKLLASLNHPNIAAIYGLEEFGGTNFLVLELVEGETVADRIKNGPIPVEESLKLALQIAEALEAAHEKGVIHRDLKPANIKITPDGKVKVLDFGLAKAFARNKEEVNLSNSPTLSDAATQQGVILGTAAYMSPEQAKGKAVDRRADIWAFGAVLFELLTGKPAFPGEEVSEILASVIKGDSNLNLLPANLHPRICELLSRCLRKDLRDRYPDIGNARYEIEQALASPGDVLVQPATAAEHGTKLRIMLAWIAAAVVMTAIIAGVAAWKLKPPEPRQVARFDYELPEGQQLDGSGHPALSVSPDGSKFVYNTDRGIYLRSVDQSAAKLILGPESIPKQPFFSPDGQWVGYWSQTESQLKRISISGGAPVSIANASSNPVLPSWGTDGMIVYGQFGTGKIMRVPATGGVPELLFEIQGKMLFAPQILPGGKSVLVTQYDGREYQVMVRVLTSRQGKTFVIARGLVARYLPTGHIVYMVGNSLFAVPFNVDKLELTGGPVSMVEGIVWLGYTSAPQYTISDSGMIVYVSRTSGSTSPGRTLVWVDRTGKEEPIPAPLNHYNHPNVSPDGKQLALTITTDGNSDIWIWDLARKTPSRLTFDKANLAPIWSSDGKRIIYFSNRDNGAGIYTRAANGTGKDEKIGSAPDWVLLPWSLSGDGKILLTVEWDMAQKYYIGMVSMEGAHTRKQLLRENFMEVQPNVSPDGRWIAYTSNESGQNEVYVRPFPEVDKGKWQVSTSGGDSPLWSPVGRELFYRIGDSVMAVALETEPAFRRETPRTLFLGTYVSSHGISGTQWNVSSDGNRFLMMKESQAIGSASAAGGLRKINIVLNWFEELKQRVPIK